MNGIMDKSVTYQAPGLIDFRMTVPIGGTQVTITFKPGRISAYRNYWATYSTSNRVVRHLIENSRAFQTGKVTVKS